MTLLLNRRFKKQLGFTLIELLIVIGIILILLALTAGGFSAWRKIAAEKHTRSIQAITTGILEAYFDIQNAYPPTSANGDFTVPLKWLCGEYALTSGTASGSDAGPSNLNDSSKTWNVNEYKGCRVLIEAGAQVGSEQTITSNTATKLYTAGKWGAALNNTSKYEVFKTSDRVVTEVKPRFNDLLDKNKKADSSDQPVEFAFFTNTGGETRNTATKIKDIWGTAMIYFADQGSAGTPVVISAGFDGYFGYRFGGSGTSAAPYTFTPIKEGDTDYATDGDKNGDDKPDYLDNIRSDGLKDQ